MAIEMLLELVRQHLSIYIKDIIIFMKFTFAIYI